MFVTRGSRSGTQCSDTDTDCNAGRCTLCCKVFSIAAPGKSAVRMVGPHCAIGSGLHDLRSAPEVCRTSTAPAVNAWMGEHWNPSQSRMGRPNDPVARSRLVPGSIREARRLEARALSRRTADMVARRRRGRTRRSSSWWSADLCVLAGRRRVARRDRPHRDCGDPVGCRPPTCQTIGRQTANPGGRHPKAIWTDGRVACQGEAARADPLASASP